MSRISTSFLTLALMGSLCATAASAVEASGERGPEDTVRQPRFGPDMPGPGFPGDRGPGRRGPGGGFPRPPFPLLLALDADNDGEISAAEIEDAPKALKKLDKDKDGKLNAEELRPQFGFPGGAMGPDGPPGFGPPGGPGPRFRFPTLPLMTALDADEDEAVSASEIENAVSALKKLDKNSDGKLGPEESLPQFGGPGGFGPPGGPGSERPKLVPQFDKDGDGRLNDEERAAARASAREQRRGGFPPFGPQAAAPEPSSQAPAEKLTPPTTGVVAPNTDLYDENTLRTFYFQFSASDWFEELGDFYHTDVEVPANLIVDGIEYPSVGVRFRGNTSYLMTGQSQKKPFNISLDFADENQRLYGYKTLNLHNFHEDPSLLREVLYSRIGRQYVPALEANFVKVVINGENWGLYANVQQFNKDFLRDWFDTKRGNRWKVGTFGRGGSLSWLGPETSGYESAYELKSNDDPDAWKSLIELCKTLDTAPDDQLEASLNPIFDIDQALWFIALENIFIDEGYVTRGADYGLYQDGLHRRFHLLSLDNNETLNYGGGPFFGLRISGADLDPLALADDDSRPVIHRLLSIPHLRARYLAHVRTIVNQSLDWDVLSPIVERYRNLITDEVKADTKTLFSYEAFLQSDTQDYTREGPPGFMQPRPGRRSETSTGETASADAPPDRAPRFSRGPGPGGPGSPPFGGGITPSLKRFVEERRAFILKHPEIKKPYPLIQKVSLGVTETALGKPAAALPTQPAIVTAKVSGEVAVDSVILYYAPAPWAPFEQTPMFDDGKHHDAEAKDGLYGGTIPPFPAGTKVRYYVEARSPASLGTTAFFPTKAEFGALTYKIEIPVAESSPVVINELMSSNVTTIRDPQGDYEDWIELLNVSEQEVDLSGMYLTDQKGNPRKWAFPRGTTLASGAYLIIWADEDGNANPGLHANFKLSRNGEVIMLIDADERGNALLDSITFGKQEDDAALGRLPDGKGAFRTLQATPGGKNKNQ